VEKLKPNVSMACFDKAESDDFSHSCHPNVWVVGGVGAEES